MQRVEEGEDGPGVEEDDVCGAVDVAHEGLGQHVQRRLRRPVASAPSPQRSQPRLLTWSVSTQRRARGVWRRAGARARQRKETHAQDPGPHTHTHTHTHTHSIPLQLMSSPAHTSSGAG
eukprot:3933873-Rhodomonas_salina.1